VAAWSGENKVIADYVCLPIRFDGEVPIIERVDEWHAEDFDGRLKFPCHQGCSCGAAVEFLTSRIGSRTTCLGSSRVSEMRSINSSTAVSPVSSPY
jgi:hypothetical protein